MALAIFLRVFHQFTLPGVDVGLESRSRVVSCHNECRKRQDGKQGIGAGSVYQGREYMGKSSKKKKKRDGSDTRVGGENNGGEEK